ncbi:MAG TPA: SGNH/GDSL hydrolase family protein [Ramlibacter sp.]|nr:SGNH/GDSL hydrolase family protein [Ramlibacter sp.]
MSRALALSLVLLVASCGGSAPAPSIVAIYGDSLQSGHIAVWPWRLPVPPARRLQQLLGDDYTVIDYAQPGARARDAITGAPTMPLGPFAEHVASIEADTIVLRYGGADAVLDTDLADFERDMASMVDHARASDRRVMLVGLVFVPEHEPRLAAFDAAIRRVAAAAGVPFVDTRSAPAGGLVDGIHPDQEYADRTQQLIAQAVRQ